jgi:PPK2 family polyphosphate:nucleotide phosphotransferase
MKICDLRVPPGKKVCLRDYDPDEHGNYKDKEAAAGKLQEDVARMAELQDVFYAANSYSLLLIFQAMDAAGKDGAIKHVMSGINPQGCQVASFKSPSSRELNHDYLWRSNLFLPERGRIGIFNRSYYEEVLVVRVHPAFLEAQRLPGKLKGGNIWKRRFREINNFERYLTDNGTRILKFFLNISKQEQKKRFLKRIETPSKNWKLSPADVRERGFWDDYQKAYGDMLGATSTAYAPWHVIPADRKWYSRVAIADIIVRELESLKLRYPKLDARAMAALQESKRLLEAGGD